MPLPVDLPTAAPAGAQTGAQTGERIAKLLARAGVASRREIERMIADGRVARDGVVLDTPACQLASLAGVTVDGAPVARAEEARLFLYHKPTGLLVTEHDPRGRPTIYDRLYKGPARDLPRLVPVGRLDLATEGLLLMTTDGELKRQLELPSTGVERSYRARAYGPVTQAQLETLIEGVEIEGIRYGPIDANLERRTGANSWIELTLTEGKNREVRRVLEHLGLQVGRLIRTRYGPFILADLPPGEIGEVRQSDLVAFRQSLSTKAKNDARIAIPAAQQGKADRRPARGGVPTTRTPLARTRTPPLKLHPGEGRGPATTAPANRPIPRAPSARTDRAGGTPNTPAPTGRPFKWRGEYTPNAPQPDAGLRRSGPSSKPQTGPTSRTPDRAAARPPAPAMSPDIPRPTKPQRKTGWAKPKPKSGPARPRKPRA